MTKKRRNKKKKVSRSGKIRTSLQDHFRVGKELQPQSAKILGKMSFSSWMNDRLPEMIWAALILSCFGRDLALELFRRILEYIGKHKQRYLLSDITITGISHLEPSLREELISYIIEPLGVGNALSTLKLFDSLPARKSWLTCLPDDPPDIELLMTSVGSILWHQSQEATDCRWVKIMARVVSGKFHMRQDMLKEWFGYPNIGDQHRVRPSIRAAEIAQNPLEVPDLTWPNAFWDEAWINTPCFNMIKEPPIKTEDIIVTRQKINVIYEALLSHWETTVSTTKTDVKHDTVFGITFYAIKILEELLGIGIGTSILSRLGIRSILEAHINLRYLLLKDDETLWKKWRTYGAGQAKLNALRFDEGMEPPKYISLDNIELIAGEDIWEEYVSINLGSWCGMDLRKMSEKVKLKETYDRHYSWTSGYAHVTWGAVRESCFQTCGNPLHRLHRYPEQRSLSDSVEEAALLVDEILNDLNDVYPEFHERIIQ